MNWVLVSEIPPPVNTHVLFWWQDDEIWSHGWRDARRYYTGDEGFLAATPPMWWYLPRHPNLVSTGEDQDKAWLQNRCAELAGIAAHRDVVWTALQRYGRHEPSCSFRPGPSAESCGMVCTCGLSAALDN